MINKKFILIVSALVLISAIILRINEYLNKEENEEEKEIVYEKIVEKEEENIIFNVIEPLDGELISSPYKIRGLISSSLFQETDYYFILTDSNKTVISLTSLEALDNASGNNILSFYSWLEFDNLSGTYKISLREKKDEKLINSDILEDITINIR